MKGQHSEKTMYSDVISRSIKVIWVFNMFFIPICYLVAINCENMKMNHKDMPIYMLSISQFEVLYTALIVRAKIVRIS